MKEREAITELVNRFSNLFDLKDWKSLDDCLSQELYTDYSDLRGTPPERMSSKRFVELRKSALDDLKTHHLSGNHEVTIDGDSAECRFSMVIFRKNKDGETLNTHCIYMLVLQRSNNVWKICGITQRVLWSDGDKGIHSGIQRNDT